MWNITVGLYATPVIQMHGFLLREKKRATQTVTMEYNSPVGGSSQKVVSGTEPFHVLFSPPVRTDPLAEKQQSSPLARSASKTPSDRNVVDGSHSHVFRDYTPARRRSRTFSPFREGVSSEKHDTFRTETPPPPTMSMFDHGNMYQDGAYLRMETMKETENPPRGRESRAQQEISHASRFHSNNKKVEDYEHTWVTVYGFHQNDLPLVLKEFSKCGDIVNFGHGNDGPYVNWIHICFDTKYAAQRALLRSGQQLSSTCMVGVKEVEEVKRNALMSQMDASSSSSARETISSLLSRASQREPRRMAEQRRKKMVAAGEEPVLPLESASMWDKVCEFVLGI